MAEYKLALDEPWTFLNARGNPVEGRRLTFELGDGTIVIVDVSHSDYLNKEAVLSKLNEKLEARLALKELFA